MASPFIADWKRGEKERLVWIDFERYAARVFAGSPVDWYRNPVRFAATIGQAHRVIPSELVSIDLTAPFLDFLQQAAGESGQKDSPAAQSAVLRLAQLLEETAPFEFVSQVVDALAHSIGDDAVLVLKLQSPRELLFAAGATDEVAGDFGALDEVGTALGKLIRRLSSKPLACLQLCCDSGLTADEEDACDPLFRAAEYYGWASALSFAHCGDDFPPLPKVDLALFRDLPAERLLGATDRRFGGGLPALFWLDGGSLPAKPGVLYGVIPEESSPETVAERMQMLSALR